MSAGMLRDSLRKLFGLQLTPHELGAVMTQHDPGREGFVRCRHFLRYFQQLSADQKLSLHRRQIRTVFPQQRAIIEVAKDEWGGELVDWRFEPEHLDSVLAKLEGAMQTRDASDLIVLNGRRMTADEVSGILLAVFKLAPSALELGALLHRLGVPANPSPGTAVDSLLLKAMLLRLKQAGRAKQLQQVNAERRRRREEEEARQARATLLERQRQVAAVDFSYDDADRAAALSKIAAASGKYQKNSTKSSSLKCFDCAFLTPPEFREVLKLVVNVILSGKELSALVENFEYGDSGNVSCAAFLNAFMKMGTDERSKARLIQLERQRRKESLRRTANERKIREVASKHALVLDYSAVTEVDRSAALEKLSTAAFKYDRADPAAIPLDGFFPAALSASEFREQLRRTFGLTVSTRELCALIDLFDGQAINAVDSQRFLQHFLKLGTSARHKARARLGREQRERVAQREREESDRAAALSAAAYWISPPEFSQEDEAQALLRLAEALQLSKVVSIASEALATFRGEESLEVAAFRRELRIRVGLRLEEREWSALSHRFADAATGHVLCVDFLSHVMAVTKGQQALNKLTLTVDKATGQTKQESSGVDACISFDYTPEDYDCVSFIHSWLLFEAIRHSYDYVRRPCKSCDKFVSQSAMRVRLILRHFSARICARRSLRRLPSDVTV
jgi:hypothetical protein